MKKLLILAAVTEALTGLTLLVYPPILVRLLFDSEIAGAGLLASRIAGISLIASAFDPVGAAASNVTIGASFSQEIDANGKTLWQERNFGKLSRAIRLPEPVDANGTQATHVDGVLQLTLPKVAKANSKQITIQ